MRVDQILPILVPGVLIQIAIQIFYIKKCWENPDLTTRKKARWIIAIALFNLPASIVYLLVTREKDKHTIGFSDEKKINPNIKQAVSVLLYLFYMIFTITILFNNATEKSFNIIVMLLGVNFVLLPLSWFFNDRKFKVLHYIIPVISLVAASYVNYLGDYSTTTLIVLVIAANIINNHKIKASGIYAIVGFILFVGMETAGLYRTQVSVTIDELVGFIYLNASIYLLVFAAFYLLKRQLLLNDSLQDIIEESTQKSKALEEMTAISERNKIAGEIHDTVGHTLTTAMISLDAAYRDIGENDNLAKEKVQRARQQIKKGMDDIRYSVRTIKYGSDDQKFDDSFPKMLKELEKSTGIILNGVLELKSMPLPLHRNFIFRVIKECVTNSAKHSHCTEADVLLSETKGVLGIIYSDNGAGTDNLKEGFGLSNIRKMSEAMGGDVLFQSVQGEGFTMNLRIPVGREESE